MCVMFYSHSVLYNLRLIKCTDRGDCDEKCCVWDRGGSQTPVMETLWIIYKELVPNRALLMTVLLMQWKQTPVPKFTPVSHMHHLLLPSLIKPPWSDEQMIGNNRTVNTAKKKKKEKKDSFIPSQQICTETNMMPRCWIHRREHEPLASHSYCPFLMSFRWSVRPVGESPIMLCTHSLSADALTEWTTSSSPPRASSLTMSGMIQWLMWTHFAEWIDITHPSHSGVL